MRKITRNLCVFLFAWACSFAAIAQTYEDVTDSYLKNARFDKSFNCGVDDNSNLATGDAVEKVIESIEDWTLEEASNWSVVATFAYGTSSMLNNASIPTVGADGIAAGGALGISVGWGASIILYQDVTLPVGKYKLEYATYNSSNDGVTQGGSNVGWTPSSGSSILSSKTSFALNTWETESVEFTIFEESTGKIQIGLMALSGGTGANAKVCFDYVKLYSYVIDKTTLENKIKEVKETVTLGSPGEDYMKGVISVAESIYNNANATEDEILQAIEDLDAALVVYGDNSLTSLMVDGVTIEGFNAEVLDYIYYVNYNASVPTVSASTSKEEAGASVSISAAAQIPGVTVVTVTAGSGSTREYNIDFIVDYIIGWDAYGNTTLSPYDAGWRSTDSDVVWEATPGSGSFYQYRDDLGVGRAFIHPMNHSVFSYPITLQGGKAYTFSCSSSKMSGDNYTTRPTTFTINTSVDASGTILGSDNTPAAKWGDYTNHSFSFVCPSDGVYYMTWQTETGNGSTDRSLAFGFKILQIGNGYTVIFDTDGGEVIENQYVVEGNTITKPEDPTRTGYIFRGWYSDASFENEYNFSIPVTSDITIYVKWEDLKGELKTLIETATELLEGGTEKGIEYLQNVIELTQVIVDNEEATEELIQDAYNLLMEAIEMYRDANLLDLLVDGVTISGFSATTYMYTYSLESANVMPVVTAEGNECADINIEQLAQLPGNAIVTVTAGNGSVQTYSISFVVNIMAGWDLNGQDGTPGDAGWVTTNPADWNGVNSSVNSHCYRDNIIIDSFTGRTLTTAASRTFIYSYPVELIGGKFYKFTGRFGIINEGDNPASTNFDFNTSADRENGTSLVSRTQSMAHQSFSNYPEASFFVPVTGTYYFTFQVTTGARALLADLALIEISAVSASNLSSFSDGALYGVEHLILEGSFTSANFTTLAAKLGNNEILTSVDLTNTIIDTDASDVFGAINGNSLKYFANGATVPDSWTNAIVGDIADEIVLTDGAPFNNIQAFNSTSISYTRTFAEGWSTFCLPFSIDDISNLGTIEEFDKVKENAISFVTANSIEANAPYLINTDAMEKVFSASNVEVPVTNPQTDVFNATFKTLPKEESTGKFILVEEDGKELFLRASATATIPAFRAYISLPDNVSSASYAVLHNGEDGTTNIGEVVSNRGGINVYSSNGAIVITAIEAQQVIVTGIDGCLVKTIVLAVDEVVTINNLAAGIYLVNNQKVVVR